MRGGGIEDTVISMLQTLSEKVESLTTKLDSMGGDEFSTTGFGKTVLTEPTQRTFTGYGDFLVGKFNAPLTGFYNLKIWIRNQRDGDSSGKYASAFYFRILRNTDLIKANNEASYLIRTNDYAILYKNGNVGSAISLTDASNFSLLNNSYETERINSDGQYHEVNIIFYAEKDEMIMVSDYKKSSSGSPTHSIQNVVVTCGSEVQV